jgi:hypothetical protein
MRVISSIVAAIFLAVSTLGASAATLPSSQAAKPSSSLELIKKKGLKKAAYKKGKKAKLTKGKRAKFGKKAKGMKPQPQPTTAR